MTKGTGPLRLILQATESKRDQYHAELGSGIDFKSALENNVEDNYNHYCYCHYTLQLPWLN